MVFEYLRDLLGLVEGSATEARSKMTKAEKVGAITIQPHVLALAAALAQVVGAKADDYYNDGTCVALATSSAEAGFSSTVLMLVAVLFFVVGFFAGWRKTTVAESQVTDTIKIDKQVQSQCHYTWRNEQPRFMPLGAAAHGCFKD
jgi:hypothetical protein